MTILGDIHGTFRLINQYGLKGNWIQVGDFGLGFDKLWKDEKTMDYWNTSWKARKTHVYAIRGNHDNPIFWDGRYEGRWSNITLVPDYTVLTLEGQRYLFMGGAVSVDRADRKTGWNYWPDEIFDYDEEKLLNVLKDGPIDIVITHAAPNVCAPYGFSKTISNYKKIDPRWLELDVNLERELLTRALHIISLVGKPKKWFYGHYHWKNGNVDIIDDMEFRMLGIGEITNI